MKSGSVQWSLEGCCTQWQHTPHQCSVESHMHWTLVVHMKVKLHEDTRNAMKMILVFSWFCFCFWTIQWPIHRNTCWSASLCSTFSTSSAVFWTLNYSLTSVTGWIVWPQTLWNTFTSFSRRIVGVDWTGRVIGEMLNRSEDLLSMSRGSMWL